MNVNNNFFDGIPLPIDRRRNYLTKIYNVSGIFHGAFRKLGEFAKLILIDKENVEKQCSVYFEEYKDIKELKNLKSIIENQFNIQIKIDFNFFEKLRQITLDWEDECKLTNKEVTKQPSFAFDNEDFKIANIASSTIRIGCQQYAFYQLNEWNAINYIFNKSSWPNEYALQPLTFYKKWGYELTEKPVSGDLVVYCLKEYKNKNMVKHFGIWTKNDKVLSKLGTTYAYEHPLNDVIIDYGNVVYFFHKKIKSSFVENFLNEIDRFSIGFDSPLTPKGCVTKLYKFLDNTIISLVFKKSIYNVNYNFKIKVELEKKILEFSSMTEKLSRVEVLEMLKKMTLETSEFFSSNLV